MSDSLQSLFSRCDSVLVFDTETSGLSWQRDEIIEFSAIRLTASGTEEVDEFIRCTRSLPPRIVELTGITDELLREEGIGKQAFAELLAALLTPGTMLAAYNAQFDLLFLYSFLQKYGDARLLQDKQKLDLLTVYRDRRAYPHRLCNAIEQYDLQDRVTNSHRAIDDVRATVEVLRAMGTERDDLERYVDLFGYSSKYGISGPRISSVRYLPQGYEPCRSRSRRRRCMMRFSSREIYDCEMPSRSATSFCVFSGRPPSPKRRLTIRRSRSGSRARASRSSCCSASSSMGRMTMSPSVPSTSDSRSSLPSQSVLIGSSSETSAFWPAILRMCMRISFSMQREA